MNAFRAAAPLPGSSAAAGARHGGGESLEKIDMSLGEERGAGEAAAGDRAGGSRAEPSAGDGEGRNEPTGLCRAPARAEPTGRGGWGGERTGPSHSEGAGGARVALGAGHGASPGPVTGTGGDPGVAILGGEEPGPLCAAWRSEQAAERGAACAWPWEALGTRALGWVVLGERPRASPGARNCTDG